MNPRGQPDRLFGLAGQWAKPFEFDMDAARGGIVGRRFDAGRQSTAGKFVSGGFRERDETVRRFDEIIPTEGCDALQFVGGFESGDLPAVRFRAAHAS